jgi:diguanylate cyclase (GGDEF)-like protein
MRHSAGDTRSSSVLNGVTALSAVVALIALALTTVIDAPELLWNLAWTVAAVSAVAGMWLARETASGERRARGTLLTAAAVSWLVGQIGWDIFSVAGMPGSPNFADVGYWGFAALVIAAMLRSRSTSASNRAVLAAENLPLIAAATALTFSYLWSDATQSSLSWLSRLSALVYPAVYVSAAILTLQAIVGGSLRRSRSAASLLVFGGIVAQAIAFILWSHQLLRQSYDVGATILDPLWACGLIAIGVGGMLAARSRDTEAEVDGPSRHGGVLPAAMFLVLIAALGHAYANHEHTTAVITLVGGLVLCGISLIARGALLERRLRVMLARERAASAALAAREEELAKLNERLTEDSRRDALTGLRNRRALSDDLPALLTIDRERGFSTAFALCDIDHFKAYNDQLGHLAGDQALRAIAATIRGTLRAGDIAYRFGGEELLLLLRETTPDEAVAVAERVRAAVRAAAMPHPASPQGILTISVGVAPGPGDVGTLLNRADAALYQAKHAGRDRVAVASDELITASADGNHRLPIEPVPRHLQSMLTMSRAAVSGTGPIPVLETLASTIRSELSFASVVVNLIDGPRQELRAVVVLGADELRRTLLGTSQAWSEWEPLLADRYERCGAIWVPVGSFDWPEDFPGWSPEMTPAPGADSWHPDDVLLLPLRSSDGQVLAIVSVDEPLSGRRPGDAELQVLMAVADHAGLALERALRDTLEHATLRKQSEELLLAAVMLLAEAVDLRDAGTASHSRTVGVYARDIACALGLPPERLERIHAAGVLHDLGKVGIADAILLKPGALSPEEWDEMRRHPEIGAQILEHAGMDDIAGFVRSHHERLDGKGYPLGLTAEEIPIEARILAVADAYEAMTAERPYRTAVTAAAAREELTRCAGTQFDPAVVTAFLAILDDGEQAKTGLISAA